MHPLRRALQLLLTAILASALAVAGYSVYLITHQEDVIFPRRVNTIAHPSTFPAPFQPLTITADGTRLHGILLPAQTSSPTTLILAFAGNAHDAVGFATFLKNTVFPTQPVSVAALSYRGYPNVLGTPSGGTPTQANLYADALTFYDQLTTQLRPQRVALVGYSIGSAVASHLASHRQVSATVLVAPIASITRLAQASYPFLPVRTFLKHPMDTENNIKHITTPLTLIYTPTDGLIPTHHVTQYLAQANLTATLIPLTGVAHGTIFDTPAIIPPLQRALLP